MAAATADAIDCGVTVPDSVVVVAGCEDASVTGVRNSFMFPPEICSFVSGTENVADTGVTDLDRLDDTETGTATTAGGEAAYDIPSVTAAAENRAVVGESCWDSPTDVVAIEAATVTGVTAPDKDVVAAVADDAICIGAGNSANPMLSSVSGTENAADTGDCWLDSDELIAGAEPAADVSDGRLSDSCVLTPTTTEADATGVAEWLAEVETVGDDAETETAASA